MDNVLLKTKLLNELPAVINNLSSEQKTIIDATDNIITVIAGAGAGKTTVMVLKALKTLLDGKNNILILTFSNEGVNSLRKKVDYYFSLLVKTAFLTDDDIEQIDLLKRKINISTFHAMAYKVLLFNKVNITILLEKERLALIKEILIKENSNLDAKKVNTKINYYQCNQKHARDIVSEATEEFKDIYLQYEQYCKENNVVDFNELQMRFINFLKTTEELLFKEYSLFVDEFQDTDLNQIEIIKALKAKGKINSIVAIGDPRQSIYMFRGASPSNIDNFSKDFNSQVFYLNNNYRSNTIIVEKANRLIKSGYNYPDMVSKSTFNFTQDDKVYFRQYPDKNTEQKKIIFSINNILEYDNKCSIAVLYRTNLFLKKLEKDLTQRGMEFFIAGSLQFTEYAEIKDILAFCKIIHNPSDSIALKRCLLLLDGVGKTTVSKINSLKNLNEIIAHKITVKKSIYSKCIEFKNKYIYIYAAFKKGIPQGINEIEKQFKILSLYERKDKNEDSTEDRKKRFDKLLRLSNVHQDLGNFLFKILANEANQKTNNAALSLMTIHKSKGLEFDYVFLPCFYDNHLPLKVNGKNFNAKEELNIAYVAMTRAKRGVFISHSQEEMRSPYLKYLF